MIPARTALRLAVVLALPLLAGCQIAADAAAIGVGAGAGAATGNPAVAVAVGIGARSVLRELGKYFQRSRQAGEQDAIATAAGTAAVGTEVPWEIRHTIPYGNHHGTLVVASQYTTPLTTCREVVFAVAEDDQRSVFATSLCQSDGPGGHRWRWAAAEPAVARWGTFQ